MRPLPTNEEELRLCAADICRKVIDNLLPGTRVSDASVCLMTLTAREAIREFTGLPEVGPCSK